MKKTLFALLAILLVLVSCENAPLSHTVTIDANGGTINGASSTFAATVLDGAKLSDVFGDLQISYVGKDFKGYALASDETEEENIYTAASDVTVTADITIYAIWTDHIYTWSYDLNYAGCPTVSETESYTYNQNHRHSISNPTRDGYSFAGWYSQPTGGESLYNGTKVTSDGIYYAHWYLSEGKPVFSKTVLNQTDTLYLSTSLSGAKIYYKVYGGVNQTFTGLQWVMSTDFTEYTGSGIFLPNVFSISFAYFEVYAYAVLDGEMTETADEQFYIRYTY